MRVLATLLILLTSACAPSTGEKQPVKGQDSGAGSTSSQNTQTPSTDMTGLASTEHSSISGTSPVNANGVGASTITVTLKTSEDEAVVGVKPVFSASGIPGVIEHNCTNTDENGVSTCANAFRSDTPGISQLRISSPISLNGSTVEFVIPEASAENSSIVGTGPIAADDTATSNILITLLDSDSEPIVGETPTFAVTGDGTNTVTQSCTPTTSTGESVCAGGLKSDTAGVKTLSLLTPIAFTGSDVNFTSANSADIGNSSISGTGNILADGTDSSDITITLLDSGTAPVIGVTPTFAVSGTGNVLDQNCTATNSSGVSTCSAAFTTTTPEIKTLSIVTPIAKADGTVEAVAPFLETNRGYQVRACGFDMNRNGIIGEVADCNVCDGVTTDVDGDGDSEDLYYVDSDNGTNASSCGTTVSPCQSVNHVIANELDGPSVGQEDIICVRGTFNDTMVLGAALGGKTGNYVRDGQEYPDNPFMIVGWDFDDDGEYPPYDKDDSAVFTGGNGYWLNLTSAVDYIELAHLEIDNYSHATRGGIIDADFSISTHVYMHDVESIDVNKGEAYGTDSILFFADRAQKWSIENSQFLDMGSILFGSSDASVLTLNNFKFRGLTVRYFGADADDNFGAIGLGGVNGLVATHNVFDSNVSAGTYEPNQIQMINLYNCSRNITIQNNTFLRIETGVNVYISTTCGSPQVMDNVVIDRNYFGFADDASMPGFAAILIQDVQGDPLYTVDGMTITNNIIDASLEPSVYGIFYNVSVSSGSVPGTVLVAGNTISGTFGSSVIETFGGFANKPNSWVIDGNIFDSIVTGENISFGYTPSSLQSTHNAYSGTKTFFLQGSYASIAAWEGASGASNSQECTVSFVNKAGGNFALDSGDICAKDSGTDLSGLASELTFDYLGVTRDTLSGPDIGAFKD